MDFVVKNSGSPATVSGHGGGGQVFQFSDGKWSGNSFAEFGYYIGCRVY